MISFSNFSDLCSKYFSLGVTTAMLIFACEASVNAQDITAKDVNQSTHGVQLDIDSLHANVRVESIGETITVYRNSDSSKLYMLPVLLADWEGFRVAVEGLGENPSAVYHVPLRLKLNDMSISKDVLAGAKRATDINEVAEKLDLGDLSIVPHAFFRIEARVGGRTEILATSRNIEDLRAGMKFISSTTVPSEMTVRVPGTKSELLGFIQAAGTKGTLAGKLYSTGHEMKTDVLAARLSALMESRGSRRLFGDEKFEKKRKVTTNSGGGGFNVNLGFVSFGGGKSSGSIETAQSDQRILSRTYLSEQIAKNSWSLDITQTGEVPEQAIQLVTEWVIGQGKETRLQFKKNNKQEWTIGNGEIGYAKLSNMQYKEVLSSAPKIDVSADNSDTVTGPKGQSASSIRKSDLKFHNDINWTFDGGSWVPTHLDLVIISEQNLRESVDFRWSKNIVSKERSAYVQEFVTPLGLHLELATKAGPLRQSISQLADSIAHIEKYLGKLQNGSSVGYELEGRHNGPSRNSNGKWTGYRGDGKTPDRIRVWLDLFQFKPLKRE